MPSVPSLQYGKTVSTAPLALMIRFLLNLGRFCPKKVSCGLPRDIQKGLPISKGEGEHGSSDRVKAAVRTSFAWTPTPPASPVGLSNPEFHGPWGAETALRSSQGQGHGILLGGTQAACRSSKEQM